MHELTSLDLRFLLQDLQAAVGTRLDKVYQDNDVFLFTGHKRGQGKILLRILFPSLLYLSQTKEQFPQQPSGFCMFLRKRLSGAFIDNIIQHGFQRVLVFTLGQKDQSYRLVLELFGKGNLILCDDHLKIVSAYKNAAWSDRAVRGGLTYVFPQTAYDPEALDARSFAEAFTKAKKSISGFLAKELAFGRHYAAEICRIVDMDPKAMRLDATALDHILTTTHSLFQKRYAPVLYPDGVFTAFPLQTLPAGKTYPRLSALLDDVVGVRDQTRQETHHAQEKKSRQSKTQKIISSQEKILANLEHGEKLNQRKGELIYEHYTELQPCLEQARTLFKDKDWDALGSIKKTYAFVKKIDKRKGVLVVEFPDGQ